MALAFPEGPSTSSGPGLHTPKAPTVGAVIGDSPIYRSYRVKLSPLRVRDIGVVEPFCSAARRDQGTALSIGTVPSPPHSLACIVFLVGRDLGGPIMGTYDRTAVLNQRWDELASGLSELEDLRSRVIAAEQMHERHSLDGKSAAAIRRNDEPKSPSAKADRPKRRLARPSDIGQ